MSQSQLISMKATATLLAIALFTGAIGYLCALFLLPVFPFHSTVLFTGLVFAAVVITVIYLIYRSGVFEGLNEPFAIGMFITFIVGIISFASNNHTQAAALHRSAGKSIAQVEKIHGFEPAIAARYNSIQTLNQAHENITFLRETSYSSTSEKDVLNYLMASEIMGLDADFVRLNAMVRDLDKKRLFQHIRTQALENGTSANPSFAHATALAKEI